ncbi:3-dehydroquinate synthase [Haliangium ochraceum]|uniref:Multifunctional fusion protein n=1 Tax=Haliangium ochraceum (strain DSM 14365 / JCM 11303 / SMP-2) TaxID=502025 RepID=D0LHN2_HALO1|nr:3-dehydroquinate synthase [Haliangium ochraceum]ACY12894.1 3-dehydroquinate synthase [Haliangium ochraceum DSM 14365]
MPRHVFLTGFMATGKSTVGRQLAARLRRPFLDLDDAVEAEAGHTVADIFASEGEIGFRRRERAALQRIADGPAAVIATGGGAACHGDNLAQMRRSGLTIALTAPLATARARADAGERERPLLRATEAELEALYRSREPMYRQAHACVRTEDSEPALLAREIAALVARAETLPDDAQEQASWVALREGAYPVVVAEGGSDRVGTWLRSVLGERRPSRVAVVSDDNVAPLHGERVRRAIDGADLCERPCSLHTVAAGERSKRFEVLGRLVDELVAEGLDRSSLVVALGGGVVGDLAGFTAACLYRGVPVVQVPSTLLAMTDAAIGGKTGIDIAAGKNLVGAFWQPRMVVVDPALLATLPARELRAAFGELIKYGLLDGEELYARIEALADALAAAGDEPGAALSPAFTEIIRRCAAIKCWIVTRDQREQTGERALLNLGHTVGHAIEAACAYEGMLHGEAVALGLVAACRVSARLGQCADGLEERVRATVERAGLDADLDRWLRGDDAERVLGFLATDKKRAGKRIGFVTIGAMGDCGITPIELAELVRILRP